MMGLPEQLRFAGDFPPLAVFALAGIAAVAVLYLYGRATKDLAKPYSYLLPALRACVVVLAIIILAGPVWHKREVVGTLGRVIFAVDTSESMSVNDSGQTNSQPARIERVSRLLIGDENQIGWLESLRETHEVDVVAFDEDQPTLIWASSDSETIPTALGLTAEGNATNLSSVLIATMNSLNMNASEISPDGDSDSQANEGSLRQAAIVLLTDGRNNLGPSAVDLAKQIQTTGTSIHAVGFGSPDEPPDVGIVDVVRPESVASDGKLAGELVVKRIGPTDQPVTVRIESGGKTVWQKTLALGESNRHTVPFEIDVEPIVLASQGDIPRGIDRSSVVLDLVAAIDPTESDDSPNNNTAPFRVSASTRDRRVLILDGSSRWESRYLRNLFERDPAWQVDTILFGPGTPMPRLQRGEQFGQFPSSDKAMAQYDAVILGEVFEDQLSSSDLNLISTFVAQGGGLVLIDGRHGRLRRLAATDFGEVFPVRYVSGGHRVDAGPLGLTRLGADQPMMNLIGDAERLESFWSKLPSPTSTANIQVKEAAETWVDTLGRGGGKMPWLVTHLYGAGRVFYFGTDQTWRWRYKVADKFHSRFWNQLMVAAMQPPYSASDQFASIGTDKVEYDPGQRPVIRVRLRDPRGNPVSDSTVDALLVANDKVVATVPLAVDDPARGTYLGLAPPMESGDYTVRVRASGFDESALQATTRFWVGGGNRVEMQSVSLDANALQQIAIAGSGRFVHESQADRFVDTLRPLSSGTVIESDTVVWQTYWWFSAIIVLLSAEWLLRKRAGLV